MSSSWQTFKMPFGKYVGETLGDLADVNPGYIIWMSENLSNGNVKRLACEARRHIDGGNAVRRESKGAIEYIKIKLLRETPRVDIDIIKEKEPMPYGILAVRVSGLENTRLFEDLNEYCRLWDADGEYWRVPLALLGDILIRFPDARVYGELENMIEWAPPEPLEKQLVICIMNSTALPALPAPKEKKPSEFKWHHLKGEKIVAPGNFHYAEKKEHLM